LPGDAEAVFDALMDQADFGRALEEPFINYDRALFCDRAVVGGWERTTEPILPYTTAETMDAGWAWQIEHEHLINRGYVFASQSISDEDAIAEFQRQNPKVPASLRVVKFRSGRYRRLWVDNVLAVGNAGGFVEPLEATALMVVCAECQAIGESLAESAMEPTSSIRDFYNRHIADSWDEIRDFLALHYKVNTRLDTPFWRQCREDTELSRLDEFMEFYAQNGPTGLSRYTLPQGSNSNFGVEGWLVMMVGNCVPYRARHQSTKEERMVWNRRRAEFAAIAQRGLTVKEALACVRDPRWMWNASRSPKSGSLEEPRVTDAVAPEAPSFAIA